ncbi:MAG: SDR family oxidoreductase [Polyangiaceae bacterium]|nr:SDR family oxidoreductase [Polyangiaceae bacterium]
MFSLDKKVAVVTGAGSGIGQAIAVALAQSGARVVGFDLSVDGLSDTAQKLAANGHELLRVACDVSNPESVAKAFAEVDAKCGRLDVLVNNAGIAHIGNIEGTQEADMDRLYNVNVKGVYLCAKQAVTRMLTTGGGSIVNVASIASLIGVADRFAYSMTKGAVLTMTYSLAVDYMKKGIRCNCVCPARVHTPFVDNFIQKTYPGQEAEVFKKLSEYQPIGRMGKPEEVAALVLFLCSDEAAFITGAAMPVDGGVLVS